jgi:hypothetical protein
MLSSGNLKLARTPPNRATASGTMSPWIDLPAPKSLNSTDFWEATDSWPRTE